jgi:hypothetical protein
MSKNLDNVLLLALANNELEKFIVGEPFYFQEAKNDNDEPQNVIAAFNQLVLRYWLDSRDSSFPSRFVSALIAVLHTYPDQNRAIYAASDWVWYYRYCLSKKYAQPQGMYADLFDVDLNQVASVLKQKLEENRADLCGDTRWAGVGWNSKRGMWDPLIRTAIGVRDKLGGPDFVPSNL